MLQDCESTCKFCVIHEYGVYILNICGIIILLLVIKIYWKEIVSFCTGKSRKIPTEISFRDEIRPTSPPIVTKNIPIYTQPIPIAPQPLAPQPVPAQPVAPYVAYPIPQPPNVDRSRPLPQEFNRRSFKAKRNRRLMTPATHALDRRLRKTVPETPSPASPDPFKLPTPSERDIIADDESTGSNYYKQMMKGKKPVLSISQYLDKKHKKGKNHTKKERKEKTVQK